MAKNRKYQSAAIRFGPALKAFLLCLIIGGSGVGYVWQKSQIDELGRQIKQRETRLNELQSRNKKTRDQLAILRSPAELDQRARKLGLGQPEPAQVWRLTEPVAPPAGGGERAPQQLAAQPVRGELQP